MNIIFYVMYCLLAVAGFYYLFEKYKEYRNFKKILAKLDQDDHGYQKEKFSSLYFWWLWFNLILIISAIITLKGQNILLFLVLALYVLAEMINSTMSQLLLFNEKSIVINGHLIKFKDLSNIVATKNLFIKGFDITTKKGEIFRVSQKVGSRVIELKKQR